MESHPRGNKLDSVLCELERACWPPEEIYSVGTSSVPEKVSRPTSCIVLTLHVVSLLVDLQRFYDSVGLESLLDLWEPMEFLPS